jgi:hypothetical protein
VIKTAVQLAQRGMAVFPCMPCGRSPATAHGFKDATKDLDVIRGWWRAEPTYNIAIATGAVSGVFVVDVDGLDAEAELRKLEAEHGELPPSVEVITARGRHIYFKAPQVPVRNSAGKIASGMDVRGDGGYVLTPPSMHPSGRRYCWSVDSANTFAAPPRWLLDKITAPASGADAAPPSAWRELVKAGVAEGARDNTVARLAGYLLRRRIDPFVALELLQSWNATRCAPPLPEEDIERIVGSIAGKELQRRQVDGG